MKNVQVLLIGSASWFMALTVIFGWNSFILHHPETSGIPLNTRLGALYALLCASSLILYLAFFIIAQHFVQMAKKIETLEKRIETLAPHDEA